MEVISNKPQYLYDNEEVTGTLVSVDIVNQNVYAKFSYGDTLCFPSNVEIFRRLKDFEGKKVSILRIEGSFFMVGGGDD